MTPCTTSPTAHPFTGFADPHSIAAQQACAAQLQPQNINFTEAQTLLYQVQQLEGVHKKACEEFARINHTLQNKGGNPITFEALRFPAYQVNGDVSYNQVISDLRARYEQLKGRIHEIAEKTVEVETLITNIDKVRARVEQMARQQHHYRQEPVYQRNVYRIPDVRGFDLELPSAKDVQKIAFWGVFTLGLVTNNNLVTSLVAATLASVVAPVLR